MPDAVLVTCGGPGCDRAAEQPPEGTPQTEGRDWTYHEGDTPFDPDGWWCPLCVELDDAREQLTSMRMEVAALEKERAALRGAGEWMSKVMSDAAALHNGRHPQHVDDPRIALFAYVMKHELAANEWKGDWKDAGAVELGEDLVYHALKLILACENGDHMRALEFAADCGNLAMMAAEQAEALDAKWMQQRGEHGERAKYDPPPYRERIEDARRMVPEIMRQLLQATARELQIRRLLDRHPTGQIPPPVPF